MAPRLRAAAAAAALLLGLAAAPAAQAGSRYCDAPPTLNAGQQSRLLRAADLLRRELDASGSRVALLARSGLNLRWWDMRYSHAGLSLRANAETPWAVRQLYFSCDDMGPRLFDQGLSAFLLGTEDPDLGFVSVLLLPEEAGAPVEALALDNRAALSLKAPVYSANAYPFSTRYQNCNQWVAELLARAWGGDAAHDDALPREAAQRWLQAQGYTAATFGVGWRPLLWLTAFSPYLQLDDHPEHERAQAHFRVSMPEALAGWVQARLPQARTLELCHTREHLVLRRGGAPLPADCTAQPGDTVVRLD